jgi:hypothetical protein
MLSQDRKAENDGRPDGKIDNGRGNLPGKSGGEELSEHH